MILINELLEKRIAELQKLIDIIESRINNYPSGRLRISSNGKMTTYYQMNQDLTSRYINRTENTLAEELAQKDYDERILNFAKDEVIRIKKFISKYNPEKEIEIFDSLNENRQKLVTPLICNKSQMINIWNNTTYEKKPILEGTITFKTQKNELVRSKSEKIIADMLFYRGIPYHYEYPIQLEGIGTVHPDFRILNVRTRRIYIWEHLGMMDDPNYAVNNVKKINYYSRNGYYPGENIIYSFETKNNFDTDAIDRLMNKYLV